MPGHGRRPGAGIDGYGRFGGPQLHQVAILPEAPTGKSVDLRHEISILFVVV
jgi:hypothetical protein